MIGLKKYFELLKNFGLLTISNFGSKLLSFFLVPLYTSILSTEDYGNYDFIYTTISLLIPLLTIDISGAALRFLLDKKKKDESIVTYSFLLTVISILIVILLTFINHYFSFIKIFDYYMCFFIAYYISSVMHYTLQNIVRGLDKLKIIALAGFINSALVLLLNILFLLYLNLGLYGYFLAYIISNSISCVYLFLACKVYKFCSFKSRDRNNEIEMRRYSLPLMLNSIGWWINNASDRYMVTYMVGISANGLYSLAYKIPSLLSIIQNIFNQAWTISAVKSYDDAKKDDYYKNIYSLYNFSLVMGSSVLILFTKIFALLLYKNEFYNAWVYMPLLILSNLFGGASGFLGGVFAATKDSKTMGRTTIIGALLNIIINFILINKIGAMGAAIGTLVSFFIVWLIRYVKVSKDMKISNNIFIDIICYIILLTQAVLFYIGINEFLLYILNTLLLLILIIINRGLIIEFMTKLLEKVKDRRVKENVR